MLVRWMCSSGFENPSYDEVWINGRRFKKHLWNTDSGIIFKISDK